MTEEKKFTTAEVVIGGLFTLVIDVIAGLFDLIPIFGWVVATTLQVATSFGTTLWVMSKGSKRATRVERQLTKQLSNLLPVVPTCFVAFVIEVIIHNSPALDSVVEKAQSKTKG